MKSEEKLSPPISRQFMNRRDFLAAGAVLTAAFLFPNSAVAGIPEVFFAEKTLSFYNTHTGEKVKAEYWSQGKYLPEALADINHILRDHRTGEVKEIDTGLLDLLFVLRQRLESTGPFHIISGYRSQETNSFLRLMGRGVANNSLHLDGKAIDIRFPGHELKSLHKAAVELQMGGVGYYASADFVHLDVGKIRYW